MTLFGLRAIYRRFSRGNSFLANDGRGGFEEQTEDSGLSPAYWAWGSAAFDYDADGDEDVFCAAGFYTGSDTKDT